MNTITYDFETTSVNAREAKLVLYAYKLNNGDIQTSHDIEDIRPYLESSDWMKCCHNGKYEYACAKAWGIKQQGICYDSQIAVWLLNMGIPKSESDGSIHYDHKLKHLAKSILGHEDAITFDELASKYTVSEPTGKVRKNNSKKYGYKKGDPVLKKRKALAHEIPSEILGEYCKKDVSLTWQLYQYAEKKLKEQGLWDLFQLECSLIPVLASMEESGILVDVDYLTQYKNDLETELVSTEFEMNKIIDKTITRKEEPNVRPNTEPTVQRGLSGDPEAFTF